MEFTSKDSDLNERSPVKPAVMWYMADLLPELRAIRQESFQELQTILKEADRLSNENPLHMIHEAKFQILSLDHQKKFTGCQVIALMVAGLWVLVGEKEDMAGSLCEAWPIAEAMVIAGTEPAAGRRFTSKTRFEEQEAIRIDGLADRIIEEGKRKQGKSKNKRKP